MVIFHSYVSLPEGIDTLDPSPNLPGMDWIVNSLLLLGLAGPGD